MRRWLTFLQQVAADPRIPQRDKLVLIALVAYLVSPLDLIPDFIPLLGYLDDVVVLALVLDYIFNIIPAEVIQDHFPGDPKGITRVRRYTRYLSWLVPGFLKRRLWQNIRAQSRSGPDSAL